MRTKMRTSIAARRPRGYKRPPEAPARPRTRPTTWPPPEGDPTLMLLVHLGGHKTGSTALQRFFAGAGTALAEHGVRYPDLGREGPAHHGLARGREGALDRLAAFARSDGAATILVSSELFELVDAAMVASLRDAVAPRPVRVFGYVRDYRGLLPSKYAQRTKAGGNTGDFDAFFARRHAPGVLRAEASFAAWASVLGWPAIRVRSLVPAGLEGGDLLTDALAAIGCPAGLATAVAAEANASPPWQVVEAIRALVAAAQTDGPVDWSAARPGERPRGAGARFAPLVTALTAALAAAADPGPAARYPTRTETQVLAREFAAEIDRLNAVVAGPPLPRPAAEEPPERPFLPEIGAVPPETRRLLAERAASAEVLRGLSATARRAAIRAVAGREIAA